MNYDVIVIGAGASGMAAALAAAEEAAAKEENKVGILDGFKVVFTTPTALMLTIGFSGLIFVITGFMTWVPAFLQEEFGQS